MLTKEEDKEYYYKHYSCIPPPVFMIFITLAQVFDLYLEEFFVCFASVFFFLTTCWFKVSIGTNTQKFLNVHPKLKASINEYIKLINCEVTRGYDFVINILIF